MNDKDSFGTVRIFFNKNKYFPGEYLTGNLEVMARESTVIREIIIEIFGTNIGK